ncbi:MAG: polyprenyl synthetase family protein [Cellulomonadaceae bacterium]
MTLDTPPVQARTLHRAEAFYTRGHETAAACDEDFRMLWQAMDRLSRGGKFLRSRLVALAYRELGGTDADVGRHVGEAVELLHEGLLMHDDVIDHDDTRRGVHNVSGTLGRRAARAGVAPAKAEQYAAAAGILAGDLALVGATRWLALTPVERPVVARLLDMFEHTVILTASGELADVRFSLGVDLHTLGEILTMEERKTAVYSFVLPLQAGAVCAGAPERVVDGLGGVGALLGVAFQLWDDLDGVFGTERQLGKSTLTDLREGKSTALIAHARTTRHWATVAEHFGDEALTEAQARSVAALLEECGSRRFIAELAEDYTRAARCLVTELELPTALSAELLDLTSTRRRAA